MFRTLTIAATSAAVLALSPIGFRTADRRFSPRAVMQPQEHGELAMRGKERPLELYVLETTAGRTHGVEDADELRPRREPAAAKLAWAR